MADVGTLGGTQVQAEPAVPRAPERARSVRIGRASYPVVLPNPRDARLHTAATLLSIQVLGQVALGFELSITQILLSIGTCAAIELVVTFRRSRMIVWPASAMLTGNGIALLMRAEGTEHGDWWSTNKWWVFVLVAAVSMASKYLIRLPDGHLFNPSNFGLVAAFLALGSSIINPQDFWWGPMSPGLAATYALLLVGGTLITRRLHLLEVAAAFWVTFAVGVGIVALSGHSMRARWSLVPVDGFEYWWVIVASPEILVFMYFMITDPRTVPHGRVGRWLFGIGVGACSVLLMAPQTTEFASKVAVLAGLTVITLFRPLLDRRAPAPGSERDRPSVWLRHQLGPARPAAPAARPVVLGLGAVALIGATFMMGTTTTSPAPGGELTVERPAIEIAQDDLPAIEVEPDVAELNGGLADGTQVVRDLLVNLEIERRAVAEGDAELAAAGAVDQRLSELTAAIDAGDRSVVTEPDFTLMRIKVLRSANPQAIPTLGVEAHSVGADGVESTTTYALAFVGGHYLIADETA